MTRLRVPGLLIVLLALLTAGAFVAGCGGDDKKSDEADFSTEFKTINDRILDLGEQVGQAVSNAANSTDEELSRQFGTFADQLQEQRDALDGLEPPPESQKATDDLSAAMDRVIGDLKAISNAAGSNNPAGAQAATRALVRNSPALRDARRTLARQTGATVDRQS